MEFETALKMIITEDEKKHGSIDLERCLSQVLNEKEMQEIKEMLNKEIPSAENAKDFA